MHSLYLTVRNSDDTMVVYSSSIARCAPKKAMYASSEFRSLGEAAQPSPPNESSNVDAKKVEDTTKWRFLLVEAQLITLSHLSSPKVNASIQFFGPL